MKINLELSLIEARTLQSILKRYAPEFDESRMTEQEIEEHELRVFDILNAITSAIEAKKRV